MHIHLRGVDLMLKAHEKEPRGEERSEKMTYIITRGSARGESIKTLLEKYPSLYAIDADAGVEIDAWKLLPSFSASFGLSYPPPYRRVLCWASEAEATGANRYESLLADIRWEDVE